MPASPLASEPLIRDAHAGDRAVIVDFNVQLALETEGKTLDLDILGEGVDRAIADPARLRYWVAEIAGRVVGQAAVTREWSDWRNGWIWWFQSVFVEPDSRGRGVFRQIYARIRREALAESDVIGLRLYVEDHNLRAQRTYQALGMVSGGYHVYEEVWRERFKQADD